ncbi:right-handed parallel beta-helix repeat-containing protein [Candidatus Bipolaricaulota bacterium]|nr:right-handed parallel beta-helix repeat-containing protein [Candidatus Bipolaricaulota bacterium]
MRRIRLTVVGAILISAISSLAFGAENDPFDRYIATVAAIEQPIEQAASTAATFMILYDPSDWRIAAQAILNMLEGSDSPFFDSSLDPKQSAIDLYFGGELSSGGMLSSFVRPLWIDADIRGSVSGLQLSEAEWGQVAQGITERLGTDTQADGFTESWAFLDDILRLASSALQRVAYVDTDQSALRDDCLTALAFLQIAREYIRAATEYLGLEVRVKASESIQAAIDSAPEGATIWIDAGTYRETIEITKSLTLKGFGGWIDVAEPEQTYGADVAPVASQSGILVYSALPIDVTIEGLGIRDTELGLSVLGAAHVMASEVEFSRAEIGARVGDRAELNLIGCLFEENGVAILAEDDAVIAVDDGSICYATDRTAAIHVLENASITIAGTSISWSRGSGILVAGSGSLTLSDGFLSGNRGDGVLLAEQANLHLTDTFFYSNRGFGVHVVSDACPADGDLEYGPFTGTITGYGNALGERASALHSEENSTCPAELEAILEVLPAEGQGEESE